MRFLDFLVDDVQKTSTIATFLKRGAMAFFIALASSFPKVNNLIYKSIDVRWEIW
jgi:hypothetical protein